MARETLDPPFGPGAHDLKHGAAIFPQTLRWIWRD